MKITPPLTADELELFTDWIADVGPCHSIDCPGDDTCDCSGKPTNDAILRACVILHHYPSVARLARLARLYTLARAECDAWRGWYKACQPSPQYGLEVGQARAALEAAEQEGT